MFTLYLRNHFTRIRDHCYIRSLLKYSQNQSFMLFKELCQPYKTYHVKDVGLAIGSHGLMMIIMKRILYFMKLTQDILFVVHVINILILITQRRMNSLAYLEVNNLKVHFPVKGGIFGRTVDYIKAVDGVSFKVKEGMTYGLVGESGSGKSTTGKAIIGLNKVTRS